MFVRELARTLQAEGFTGAESESDAVRAAVPPSVARRVVGRLRRLAAPTLALVRAVAACSTPVVSAIGHEADRPLLDDVADLRASTPTDAAKRVVPDVSDELWGIIADEQIKLHKHQMV